MHAYTHTLTYLLTHSLTHSQLIVSRAELVSSDGLPLLELAANADVAALDALQFTPVTVKGVSL